jgi:hypothetical protein
MTQFVAEHGIDIGRLVTHHASLDDGQSAFELADQPTFVGKVAFTFN